LFSVKEESDIGETKSEASAASDDQSEKAPAALAESIKVESGNLSADEIKKEAAPNAVSPNTITSSS
jgi:hypothetical protein